MTKLIDTEELSRRLEISRQTVVKMIKGGSIPYIKVSGCYRFDYDAVIWKLSNTLQKQFLYEKRKTKENND